MLSGFAEALYRGQSCRQTVRTRIADFEHNRFSAQLFIDIMILLLIGVLRVVCKLWDLPCSWHGSLVSSQVRIQTRPQWGVSSMRQGIPKLWAEEGIKG